MHNERLLPSFGRRKGRVLSPERQDMLDNALARIGIVLPEKGGVLDIQALGLPSHALHLEIGFGEGNHLLHAAKLQPDSGFIGCEPFINGVAKTVVQMEALSNIRIFADDVRLLLEVLPDACLDAVYILFPDPWPKLRHHKRRLIQKPLLDALARVQKKGARLIIASDHVDYAGWILEKLLAHSAYSWSAECKSDWETPPDVWAVTKYQRKTTQQGRLPAFLCFYRE